MASKKQLVQSDIQINPSLHEVEEGNIGFGAGEGGLYQKRKGVNQERLATTKELDLKQDKNTVVNNYYVTNLTELKAAYVLATSSPLPSVIYAAGTITLTENLTLGGDIISGTYVNSTTFQIKGGISLVLELGNIYNSLGISYKYDGVGLIALPYYVSSIKQIEIQGVPSFVLDLNSYTFTSTTIKFTNLIVRNPSAVEKTVNGLKIIDRTYFHVKRGIELNNVTFQNDSIENVNEVKHIEVIGSTDTGTGVIIINGISHATNDYSINAGNTNPVYNIQPILINNTVAGYSNFYVTIKNVSAGMGFDRYARVLLTSSKLITYRVTGDESWKYISSRQNMPGQGYISETSSISKVVSIDKLELGYTAKTSNGNKVLIVDNGEVKESGNSIIRLATLAEAMLPATWTTLGITAYKQIIISVYGDTILANNGFYYLDSSDVNGYTVLANWKKLGVGGTTTGGGHTILSSTVTLPQRSKLKFIGATITDDKANDTTIATFEGSSKWEDVLVAPLHPRWDEHDSYGTDKFNFNALPAGSRYIFNGTEFNGLGESLVLGTTTEYATGNPGNYRQATITTFGMSLEAQSYKPDGTSIRCVREATSSELLLNDGTILDENIAIDTSSNIYTLVKIGTQIWTRENLKTLQYNDGSFITKDLDDTQWANARSGASSVYSKIGSVYTPIDNLLTEEDMISNYGLLYNYYAITDPRGIAPNGYRVPTITDFTVLRDYIVSTGETVGYDFPNDVPIINQNVQDTLKSTRQVNRGLPSNYIKPKLEKRINADIIDGLPSGGATNLSYTASAENGVVTSDTGTDATIPLATTVNAGLLSPSDKDKITNAEVNITQESFPDPTLYKNGDEWTAQLSGTKYTLYNSQWVEFGPAVAMLGVSSSQTVLFKGTIGEGGTYSITAFNNLTTYDYGWEFHVITAGNIKGTPLLPGSRITVAVSRNGSGNLPSDFLISPVSAGSSEGVIGPVSSIDGYPALFEGTTGKLLKCSGEPLGTAAFTNSTQYATSTQGAKADAALPAASYNANDILAKLKTVDGSGSGLDADTIDGNDITDLITSKNDIHTGTPKVNEVITLSYSQYYALGTKAANTLYIIIGT